MLIVTTNEVPGHEIGEVLGQVFGLVVRSRGLGGNIAAGLRSLVGGEIVEYTQMLEQARRHALDRLTENAATMRADAVVAMRFDSSELGEMMTEVVAYGTAVRFARGPARSEPRPDAAADAGLGGAAHSFGHRSLEP
jgi:uncharacterized protein YbjQ (UPF0145 family)